MSLLAEGSARASHDASGAAAGDASAVVVRDASRPPCDWCGRPIPRRARRDSQCCSKECRQARWRFGLKAGRGLAAAALEPLRLAYADPPYPGRAGLYRGHPDYAGEVDLPELLAQLAGYDGWALSTAADSLAAVLALAPPGARVAAWHRGERGTPSWQPVSAWEPVIYRPARPLPPGRRPDSLVYGVTVFRTVPGRVVGTKPAPFCRWVFGLMGAAAGDSLADLFPGSGLVGRAWSAYTSSPARGDASRSAASDASARGARDAHHQGAELGGRKAAGAS